MLSQPIIEGHENFRAAAVASLSQRAGLRPAKNISISELSDLSFSALARESLRVARLQVPGDAREMFSRALTTSDFPYILSNVAEKSLFEGFDDIEEAWKICFDTGSVSNFKTHSSVRASESDDLEEVKESGEFKHGSRGEAQEEYHILTYGKIYSLSRQALINDDLNALTDPARMHGEAAARKIGDIAFAALTGSVVMGDGVTLFHSNHSNIGSAGSLSASAIGEAIKLMKMQKDIKGSRCLNIRPRFFIAPVAIESSSEQFFTSVIDPGKAINGVNNPYAGEYFTRVYEPRLDDLSATAWYLAGAKGKTVKVFFLDGKQKPYIESRPGWNVDGVEYKIRIDAGAKAMDWRALVKNAGA